MLDAGVVDEDVDVLGQGVDGVEVRQVHGHRSHRGEPREDVETGLVAVHGIHGGAGVGEPTHAGCPDPARGPGHHGGPAAEVEVSDVVGMRRD